MRTSTVKLRGMHSSLPLSTMTREQKLRELEALWADLTREADEFESPAWHATALRETAEQVESGQATFDDWEAAKQRLLKRAHPES